MTGENLVLNQPAGPQTRLHQRRPLCARKLRAPRPMPEHDAATKIVSSFSLTYKDCMCGCTPSDVGNPEATHMSEKSPKSGLLWLWQLVMSGLRASHRASGTAANYGFSPCGTTTSASRPQIKRGRFNSMGANRGRLEHERSRRSSAYRKPGSWGGRPFRDRTFPYRRDSATEAGRERRQAVGCNWRKERQS